jgi:fructose-bisphosphate aldolase class I
MNRLGPAPWRLTFSFSRALVLAPLKVWAGRAENVAAAQRAFAARAEQNSLASLGKLETASANEAARA